MENTQNNNEYEFVGFDEEGMACFHLDQPEEKVHTIVYPESFLREVE